MSALGVLCVVAAAVVAARAGTYTSRWDNVDVERILKNERLLRSYFRCIMDQGRCSTDAAELRKNLPEALSNDCAKCTDKQKQHIEKVMKYLYEKRPEMFSQIEKKYDHLGTYREKYEKGSEAEKAKGTEATKEPGASKSEDVVKKEVIAGASESEKKAESVKAAEIVVEEQTIKEREPEKSTELEKADAVKEGEMGKEKVSLKVAKEVKHVEREKPVGTERETEVVKSPEEVTEAETAQAA